MDGAVTEVMSCTLFRYPPRLLALCCCDKHRGQQQHGKKRTCFSLQLANQQENKTWETLKAET